jgi:hypothetical protein
MMQRDLHPLAVLALIIIFIVYALLCVARDIVDRFRFPILLCLIALGLKRLAH